MQTNILTPEEVLITQMALSGLIEDLDKINSDTAIPFTPESRTYQKQMLDSARSAHTKIAVASGKLVQLDTYKEGDEKEFLTKES